MANEKSCGLVLFRKHKEGIKYLLLHYHAGHWDFPKGHVEKNEKEEMTAARELKEETGISDFEFLEGFREVVNYYFKKGEGTVFKEVIFFLARSGMDEVEISSEHIGYAWLNFEHAHKKLTHGTAKELLEKADKFIKAHSN